MKKAKPDIRRLRRNLERRLRYRAFKALRGVL